VVVVVVVVKGFISTLMSEYTWLTFHHAFWVLINILIEFFPLFPEMEEKLRM